MSIRVDNARMTRQDAIDILGAGNVLAAARVLNLKTKQALYQWPEILDQTRADRVAGAAMRLGLVDKLPDQYRRHCAPRLAA